MSTRAILLLIAVLLVGSIVFLRLSRRTVSLQETQRTGKVECRQVGDAYRDRRSAVWLALSGRVSRLLPDEIGRYRHQRFVISCASGQTVLIVNDVSIGERVPARVGDSVIVRGQYVWNEQGGLVHFTHRSTDGGTGGWIELRGKVYSAPANPTAKIEMMWLSAGRRAATTTGGRGYRGGTLPDQSQ